MSILRRRTPSQRARRRVPRDCHHHFQERTVTIIQRQHQRVVVIFSGRWKDPDPAAMAELIKDGVNDSFVGLSQYLLDLLLGHGLPHLLQLLRDGHLGDPAHSFVDFDQRLLQLPDQLKLPHDDCHDLSGLWTRVNYSRWRQALLHGIRWIYIATLCVPFLLQMKPGFEPPVILVPDGHFAPSLRLTPVVASDLFTWHHVRHIKGNERRTWIRLVGSHRPNYLRSI
jgi:hypothetical protein